MISVLGLWLNSPHWRSKIHLREESLDARQCGVSWGVAADGGQFEMLSHVEGVMGEQGPGVTLGSRGGDGGVGSEGSTIGSGETEGGAGTGDAVVGPAAAMASPGIGVGNVDGGRDGFCPHRERDGSDEGLDFDVLLGGISRLQAGNFRTLGNALCTRSCDYFDSKLNILLDVSFRKVVIYNNQGA
ncbi:hypothetical protein BU17DRAFT_61020 [Hysterangium stoloniferum]|nr:hypothetical protein BU17DRAFT_61020 [Hysterangium stoloniferum]